MKYFTTICLLVFFTTISAQETEINLDNFYEVDVSNGLKVVLTEAKENKAVIKGNSRDKVRIKVENGVLKIRTTLTHILKEDNTVVNIYYKQLKKVEAGQSSSVTFSNNLKQDLIGLRAKEGASISATVDVEDFNGSAVTKGKLQVSGKAEKQNIEVKTGGEFHGENLIGSNIEVEVNGGGNANVFARNYVNSKVRAGGHIYIYGNPNQVDKQTTFGGTIKKIN